LVRHVQRLQREDKTCKIICFVQWEDLKRKIGAALDEFGVQHLSLQGSVWARRAALTRFQYDESSPRMLLLSLEESASGTNLTASNHVIIVHPMEAATREEAVAFEMQAVGRVRRPGQERKIHIWRFVTIGTIEQSITEAHQRELWQRQHERILVAPPSPGGDISDEDENDDDASTLALRPPKPPVAALPAAAEPLATQQYFGQLPDALGSELATQGYMGEADTVGVSACSQNVENEQEKKDSETLPFGGEAESAWPGDRQFLAYAGDMAADAMDATQVYASC